MPSPIPELTVNKTMTFYGAIAELINGARITRLEWGDKRHYCLLKDGLLSLHKAGELENMIHSWIVNDGDILATDWIVLGNNQLSIN